MTVVSKPETALCPSKAQAALLPLKNFDSERNAAKDLVYLCAKFCDALNGSPTYDELVRRAGIFKQLTEPRSAFEDARSALLRLCPSELESEERMTEERSVWSSVDIRLTVASLRGFYGNRCLDPHTISASDESDKQAPLLPEQARNPHALIRLWCFGPETIHDTDWARLNLHTVYAIAQSAVESEMQFEPEEAHAALVRFRDEIWAVWRRGDREHLLGSYLLLNCQDAVNAGHSRCQELLDRLSELDVQTRAAVAAAEDICLFLASSSSVEPNTHESKARDGLISQSTIGEITVSLLEKACVLRAEEVDSFVMTEDETRLFTPFIHLITAQAATGLVTWESITKSIRQESPEWAKKQHPQAAKEFSHLNDRLRMWGIPRDGAAWIGSKRGKKGGRFLNRSVNWLPDYENDLIKAFARKSPSVSGPLIDPHTAATSTPDAEHKLPARPRRNANRQRDEAENEGG